MKLKKFVSCALAVMLSLGTITVLPEKLNDSVGISITADAASDFTTRKTSSGEIVITGYKGKGGDITIPKKVSYIDPNAFKDNENITSITFKGDCITSTDSSNQRIFLDGTTCELWRLETVTDNEGRKRRHWIPSYRSPDVFKYVSNGSFYGCKNLTKVVIEGDACFSDGAFKNCKKLESVEIKGGCERIGVSSFENCVSLQNFTIKENKYQYIIEPYAFKDCVRLKNIDIRRNCSSIFCEAFINCVSLKTLTIPGNQSIKNIHNLIEWFYWKEPKIGYNYSYLTKGSDEKTERLSDGKTSVYVYAGGIYYKCTPKKLTMVVQKDSKAEKYAKKHKIAYKYISASEKPERLAMPQISTHSSVFSIGIKHTVEGADLFKVYLYNPKTKKYELIDGSSNSYTSGNYTNVYDLRYDTYYKFKVQAFELIDGEYVAGYEKKFTAKTLFR